MKTISFQCSTAEATASENASENAHTEEHSTDEENNEEETEQENRLQNTPQSTPQRTHTMIAPVSPSLPISSTMASLSATQRLNVLSVPELRAALQQTQEQLTAAQRQKSAAVEKQARLELEFGQTKAVLEKEREKHADTLRQTAERIADADSTAHTKKHFCQPAHSHFIEFCIEFFTKCCTQLSAE